MTAEPARLFDLSAKVALVTGARTGLGQAIALTLAAAGADIVGLGSAPMPETGGRVETLGRRFTEVVRDLGRSDGLAELVADIERHAGPVDILVNNAGIIRRADVLEFSEADWDAVANVNLKSLFFLSQAVARSLIGRGVPGRIINIASLLAFQGGIRVASYTSAKHGVAGLTKLMANELGAKGITVNAIAPGYMATDNTAALRADPARRQQILDRIPAGRWGEPEDLATAVLFLASPASAYVNGTIVPVDGGWLAR
ncbi:2-dehydro-3-deoxy-D-gluconate 5-dehydrogenase KduD [Aureimonas leprariae]|uniref:2-dehydro-3-deoxy-D-gluconate 5-dehydrogenase KduD n=1 Tax=Plantimonas leprariae TaxID=2615207 RepID=A0A7V7PMQ4_9HYPH|nr:2-dehydro-3-deoxy-D-gluconate 5-dehydrogenase KduD [Aureimonas leprariae]KAB0678543.1 2-dehydro-3-deoxy-D-gluconate 5-dehydrogenase KduD [Aureimonas leprariae]